MRLETAGEKMNYEIQMAGITDVLSVHLHLAKMGSNGDVIVNLPNSGTENPDGEQRIEGSISRLRFDRPACR